jgi:hypothetical protein
MRRGEENSYALILVSSPKFIHLPTLPTPSSSWVIVQWYDRSEAEGVVKLDTVLDTARKLG